MAVSRRTVIAAGLGVAGIAALGAVAGTLSGPSGGIAGNAAPTEPLLRRSRFAPLVGTQFTAEAGGGRFELTLAAVDDLAPMRVRADEDRFNLLFVTTEDEPPEGIYTLRHPDAEDVTLFISAVGPEGASRRLQALVDRSM